MFVKPIYTSLPSQNMTTLSYISNKNTTQTDISYFEDDDAKIEQIANDYRKGDLLTGELKKMAITLLQEYVKEFQGRRKEVTEELRKQYMEPRKLEWNGNPNPKPKETKESKAKKAEEAKSWMGYLARMVENMLIGVISGGMK